MAEVRWPTRTIGQLNRIAAYIGQTDPQAAADIRQRLVDLGESLATFPKRGRPATKDTRELTTVPPYVLRYQVDGDIVVILSVRHGRRRPLR